MSCTSRSRKTAIRIGFAEENYTKFNVTLYLILIHFKIYTFRLTTE